MSGGDPLGKRALFEAPVQAPPETVAPGTATSGKAALFSSGRRRPGTVLVECDSCGARVRSTLPDLGLRLLRISAWVPLRRHPHWMSCPACERHTWCRIRWTA